MHIEFACDFAYDVVFFITYTVKHFIWLCMDITFKTKKLQKTFNSEKELKRAYGNETAKKIKLRMAVLSAAPTLAQVPTTKPDRCHALQGKRKGQYAVDLKHPHRLVFCPDHNPLPKTEEGHLDLTQVTCITILSVEDYH